MKTHALASRSPLAARRRRRWPAPPAGLRRARRGACARRSACPAWRSRSSRTARSRSPRASACASSAAPTRSTPTRSSRPARPARRSPSPRSRSLVDAGQDRLGRQGHRPPARLPDVRPVGHARDDDPRPARPSQRPRARARATCCSCRARNLTRAETVRRLRYIKPATSFRSGYAYDNILYMVAGQLIEAVSGETWEKFTASTCSSRPACRTRPATTTRASPPPNRAQPHARMDGGLRGIGRPGAARRARRARHATPRPPAGSRSAPTTWRAGCRSSSHGGAARTARRLFSEAAHDADVDAGDAAADRRRAPDDLTPTEPMFNTYALGWDVRDYRGAQDRLARRRGVRLPRPRSC